jgi:predicted nucleic acid-binding protein
MSNPELFLDSSALIAGVISATGASRALLQLAEARAIIIVISEQVIVETERALARKAPQALPAYREALRYTGLRIVSDPSPEDVQTHKEIIQDETDVPIVVAGMQAQTDFLVTLNRRHFLDDPAVAKKSGLQIGTPGDALAWVRQQLGKGR